jgi:hemoglobin-like flavoprotein
VVVVVVMLPEETEAVVAELQPSMLTTTPQVQQILEAAAEQTGIQVQELGKPVVLV